MRHEVRSLGVSEENRGRERTHTGERMEKRDETSPFGEAEEYQYHASLPSLLKSLPIAVSFRRVPYYRLGKIIFRVRIPSEAGGAEDGGGGGVGVSVEYHALIAV